MTGPQRWLVFPSALCLTVALLGCPAKTAETSKTAKTTKTAAMPTVAFAPRELKAMTLPVVCGCKLPEIKRCSEWATIEEKSVRLKGDLGLKGSMPFCGKTGLSAKVSGKLEGDTLTVSAFELLPQAN